MKLSPIILSAAAATAALASAGQYLQPQQQVLPAASTRHLELRQRERQRFQQQQQQRQIGAELSTEFFEVPSTGGGAADSSVASVVSLPAPGTRQQQQQRPTIPGTAQPSDGPRIRHTIHQPLLKQQPWALPLAALSAVAMILMAGFEVFVLLKARAAAPSRRHLFLGQALLLGLFLLAGLGAAAALTANPVSCTAIRLLGLPAALVFAALLVKCVFLLSLNSGVYLPAPYQALVLMFAVLVQVAIVGQWLYGEPPAVMQQQQTSTAHQQAHTSQQLYQQHPQHHQQQQHHQLRLERTVMMTVCRTPLGQTVASLGYPGALLLAVTCLAIRARGVRDNFHESMYIGLAVSLDLPVCLVSAIGSLLAPEPEREAWLAYGLVLVAIITFLAMFLPKSRQLAALGRETAGVGIGVVGGPAGPAIRADRDERLSSLPGSGYSPSFFHFKPAEASLKRKMHYHSADRVALVSSGIPGCNACRHGASPVYSDGTSASYFEHMPYIHGPMETFVLPPGMYLRPEDTGNLYTTLSANPNVFFQRAHPGMMY